MSVVTSEIFAHVIAAAAAISHIARNSVEASKKLARTKAVVATIRHITNLSTGVSETVAHFSAVRTAVDDVLGDTENLTAIPSEILAYIIAVRAAVGNGLDGTEMIARREPLTAALNNICLKVHTSILPIATTVLLDATGEAIAGTSPDAAVVSAASASRSNSVIIQYVSVGTRRRGHICQAPVFALAAIHCHCDIRDNVGVRRVVFLRGLEAVNVNAGNSCVRMFHRSGDKCSRIRIRGSIWGDFKLNGRGGRGTQTGKEEGAGDGEGLDVHVVACLML